MKKKDKGSPPDVTSPQITCEEVDDDGTDQLVVRRVSVQVEDPDRDLKLGGEKGSSIEDVSFQGLTNLQFSDSDGDGRFVWEVPPKYDRMICDGTFDLNIRVVDQKGNEVDERLTITKNNSGNN